ncbi:MAG: restriction endonuclease [gamma proteobacterium endosymbiont of Lamellibrachia anaximandri]|nr:restriction endonuclease [gamma proteobacterium endosymbiont of Lamellibrachia anaximandri]
MLIVSNLPKLLDVASIQDRLSQIFPEGTQNRVNHINIVAARTIFVMLYLGAIEGSEYWIRPDQVTRMTDSQSKKIYGTDRLPWKKESVRRIPKDQPIVGRWYDVNSREGVRDDCLRNALAETKAVIVRKDLPTTSSAGRYALEIEFAELFDPDVKGEQLEELITSWSDKHISNSARFRQKLMQRAANVGEEEILVTFPNKETRRLAPGPSSIIAKAVIEDFAVRFLEAPAVVWISESANKEDRADRDIADSIGLKIESDKHLPDIILADVHVKHTLIIFVEVVASNGPINDQRKEALLQLVMNAGMDSSHAAFITAYVDREDKAFRKTFATLAWQSFAWCMSEPDKIIGLHEQEEGIRLQELISVV